MDEKKKRGEINHRRQNGFSGEVRVSGCIEHSGGVKGCRPCFLFLEVVVGGLSGSGIVLLFLVLLLLLLCFCVCVLSWKDTEIKRIIVKRKENPIGIVVCKELFKRDLCWVVS